MIVEQLLVPVFIIFLIVFVAYSKFALYHLQEFGYVGDMTKTVRVMYVLTASFIMIISVVLLYLYY